MIFKYNSYLDILNSKVGGSGARTGHKGKLAKAMGCAQTYLSKVLKGDADISQEQALRACRYFEFSTEETEYFLLLVLKARAGDANLRKYYKDKLKDFRESMLAVEKQIPTTEFLSRKDQQTYYSNRLYMAFHIAISLPNINTVEDLAREFEVERSDAASIVEFLLQTGLVVTKGKKLESGPDHIHLKNNAPDLIKNHTNWRLKALDTVSIPKAQNFHYTVLASLSEKDAEALKARMIEWVKDFLEAVEPSPEETVYCHTIDFFKVIKS